MTSPLLDAWCQFIREMRATNSRLEKMGLVMSYAAVLRPLWVCVFSGTTGMTAASILKYWSKKQEERSSKKSRFAPRPLLDLMQDLTHRRLRGHEALEAVTQWLQDQPQSRDELVALFSGDPRIGLDIKQMNRALTDRGHPPICSVFSVALAQPFKESAFTASSDAWYLSRKFDGVRVLVTVTPEGISARTRNGNVITALQNALHQYWKRLLMIRQTWPHPSLVLDGEMCIMDKEGKEDFTGAVSQLRQTKVPVEAFRYYIFDLLDEQDFNQGSSPIKWSVRYAHLQAICGQCPDPRWVPIETELYSEEVLVRWQDRVRREAYEGLCVRKDAPYVGERTWDLLKIKAFHTAEYVVRDITVGQKQMLNDQGVMEQRPIMASVIVQHKGHYVGVGSGFTDKQRLEYLAHPERIIGMQIEVAYQEETQTQDKAGKVNYSLRFPTVKHIWGEKRDM